VLRLSHRLAMAVVALAVVGLAACAPGTPASTAPTPSRLSSLRPSSPAPTAPASPVLLTMPNVVGQNASIALDQLKKLGFTKVELGTVDGHRFVALPQNWTVRTQSTAPGQTVPSNTKIVLGCAKNS
jgi:PASTA domain